MFNVIHSFLVDAGSVSRVILATAAAEQTEEYSRHPNEALKEAKAALKTDRKVKRPRLSLPSRPIKVRLSRTRFDP